jgi:hypothetical protein
MELSLPRDTGTSRWASHDAAYRDWEGNQRCEGRGESQRGSGGGGAVFRGSLGGVQGNSMGRNPRYTARPAIGGKMG